MPYSTSSKNLPDRVKKMSAKKRRQWTHVFNSAVKGGADEESAFAQAYGVAGKGYIEGYDVSYRQVSPENADYNAVGGDGTKACANCNWFVSPNSCTMVYGDISPTGISKFWLEKPVYEQQPILVYITDDKEDDDEDDDEDEEKKKRKRASEDAYKEIGGGVVDKVVRFFRGDEPPIVFFKTEDGDMRWFAHFTNNFKDRHQETIELAAHKDFIQWADDNKEYPELWLWHIPGTPLGECDWLDCVDGLVCASGTVAKEYEDVATRLAKKDVALSHGFFRHPATGPVIKNYRSFEITLLPRRYAANPWDTSFNLGEDMAFSTAKREFLLKDAGLSEEFVTSMEARADAKVKELKEKGIDFKEGADASEAQQVDMSKLVDAIATLAEHVTGLQTAVTAQGTRVEAVEKSFDDKVADAFKAQIDKIPQGHKPSESSSNVTTDPASKEVAKKANDWFNEVVVEGVLSSAG